MTAPDLAAFPRRVALVYQRARLEHRLTHARTVGDVWDITTQLDAIDTELRAPAAVRP